MTVKYVYKTVQYGRVHWHYPVL